MTVEMEIQMSASDWPAALRVIRAGDSAMRPTQWSKDEDSVRLSLREESVPDELQDAFLWAEECTYEVSRSKSSQVVTIFALSPDAAAIDDLLLNLSDLNVEFGYACASAEREHRNRVSRKMSYGVHEAWVGRDFSQYLPGLYWRTIMPVALQQRLGIPVEALRDAAPDLELRSNRNWLLKLYEEPSGWVEETARIDEWCARTPGCFSKAPAVNALAEARNFIEASAALEKWK